MQRWPTSRLTVMTHVAGGAGQPSSAAEQTVTADAGSASIVEHVSAANIASAGRIGRGLPAALGCPVARHGITAAFFDPSPGPCQLFHEGIAPLAPLGQAHRGPHSPRARFARVLSHAPRL